MSNFENFKKNIKNTIMAATIGMAGTGAMAAETPKESLKDEVKTEANFEKPVASPEATAEYAERIAHIKNSNKKSIQKRKNFEVLRAE